jgi:hypothetical protein
MKNPSRKQKPIPETETKEDEVRTLQEELRLTRLSYEEKCHQADGLRALLAGAQEARRDLETTVRTLSGLLATTVRSAERPRLSLAELLSR